MGPGVARGMAVEPGLRPAASTPYDLEQSAMQDVLTNDATGSMLPTDTLVLVLAVVAQQAGEEQLVLLSTKCPHANVYNITLPFAMKREGEHSSVAAARGLMEAGILCDNVLHRSGVQLASSGVGLGGGVDDGTDASNGREASIYLESLSLLSPPRIVTPAQDNGVVVMVPMRNMRAALANLANEGRAIDDNIFFFAAGSEAAALSAGGRLTSDGATKGQPQSAVLGAVQGDFVSRFGRVIGLVWMGGAVAYAAACMIFAY